MTKRKPMKAVKAWAVVDEDGAILTANLGCEAYTTKSEAQWSLRYEAERGRKVRLVRVEIREVPRG